MAAEHVPDNEVYLRDRVLTLKQHLVNLQVELSDFFECWVVEHEDVFRLSAKPRQEFFHVFTVLLCLRDIGHGLLRVSILVVCLDCIEDTLSKQNPEDSVRDEVFTHELFMYFKRVYHV